LVSALLMKRPMESYHQMNFKNTADRECPICGNPVALRGHVKCGKCEMPVVLFRPLLVVDVAHAGEDWEEAQEKIMKAIDRALIERNKGVKIVHGKGRTTGRSVIRTKAVEFLRNQARQIGGRLVQDDNNPGAHILWLY
jgi:ribosomal protein S27AE